MEAIASRNVKCKKRQAVRERGSPNQSHHLVLGNGADSEHSRRAVWNEKMTRFIWEILRLKNLGHNQIEISKQQL